MAKIKDNNKCWWDWEEMGTFVCCCWKCEMVQSLWKTVRQFLKILNIELSYDPAIPLLGIYPRELKTYGHTKTCIRMFISSIFYNSHKVLTTQMFITWWMDEQNVAYTLYITYNGILFGNREELYYVYTDTCYNMDELWKYAKWKSQSQNTTYSMIPFIWNVQNRQIHRDRK